MTCIDCGATVEHDLDAEAWLHRTVLVNPDVVDVDNPGTVCPDTNGDHRIEVAA